MKKKIINIIEIIMLVLLFSLLIFGQFNHVLWLDELDWSLGIVDNNSLIEVNKTVLGTGENLPLFYNLLYICVHIFGYNDWILTLCTATFFTIGGIVGIIKISDKVLKRENRIYTIFFILIGYSIVSQCGWQLRPYGLMFCFSAWMLYYYLEKLDNPEKKVIVKYSISMILLMYSHWFGVLITVIYAFIDLILFIKKKINWKFIIPYIVAGLVFLPCFIVLLCLHKSDIDTYGVGVPNLYNLLHIFYFLSQSLWFNTIILVGTLCIIMLDKSEDKSKNKKLTIVSCIILSLILLTYVYSRFINPKGSIIRDRYFSVLLPHAVLLISYGVNRLITVGKKKKWVNMIGKGVLIYYIIMEIGVTTFHFIVYPNHEGTGKYKDWANFLYKEEKAYENDTLVICTYGKTWIDYYFKNKDKELPHNIIVVNPLEFPNGNHMSKQDLDHFKYYVKNGAISNDSISIDELKNYNTVYYMEEYRTISDELISTLFSDDYKYEMIDKKSRIKKFEKKLKE